MLKLLQYSDLKIYPERWGYLGEVVRFVKALRLDNLPCEQCHGTGKEPTGKQCEQCGGHKVRPPRVLELGCHNAQVVQGSVTMDIMPLDVAFWWDARVTPWPVHPHFDLVIACEVFEHFGLKDSGVQERVWQEVKRIARWAIIDVPYLWPSSAYRYHTGIGVDDVRRWTGMVPVNDSIVKTLTPDCGLRFLVGLYKLK